MNFNNKGRLAAHASAFALAIATASAIGSFAQAAEATTPSQVTEVVVTATRREERLKDVPESVTALSGAPLMVLGTSGQDVRQLAFSVPSLNIESSNGRTFPRFYIRGYGNTDFNSFASQPVSLVYDDIVQENPALKGFPVFDEADVEVLRGPQGTLFGRNTPAGVVKFESAKPQLGVFDGFYNVSDGTYNTANVQAVVNLPVSQDSALRLSVQEQHRDNWVSDPINDTKLEGYDQWAGRAQFLWNPTDNFSALFNVHGTALRGSARLFRANIINQGGNGLTNGLTPGGSFDPSKIYTDGENAQTYATTGGNIHLTWKLPGVTLYSITGYESILHYFTQGDIDGGTLPIAGATTQPGLSGGPGTIFFPVETGGGIAHHDQISQEFRAASDISGPLSWQGGVFLFDEDTTAFGNDYDNTGAFETDTTISRQKNDAEAVFGSVDYKVTDAFKLTGGLRFTEDHKTFDVVKAVYAAYGALDFPAGVPGTDLPLLGPRSESASASRVNYDVSGVYTINPDVNVYARIATGFRASSFGAPSSGQAIQVAAPEDVTSYETGVKSDLFDHRASLAFDVFYYDVEHQQLTAVGGLSNSTTLLNAKRTIGDGAELEIKTHPTDHLSINFSGSYNNTKIEDPTLAVGVCAQCTVTNPTYTSGGSTFAEINGNPLPQAAKWIGDFSLNYDHPISDGAKVYFYTDMSYRSGVNYFLYESKEFDGPELLQIGLRLGYKWDNEKYDLAVFCRNCANKIVAIGGIDFDDNTGMINDPRIVGVQFGGKF
jgi:iron complex outermembrane receptor protein